MPQNNREGNIASLYVTRNESSIPHRFKGTPLKTTAGSSIAAVT